MRCQSAWRGLPACSLKPLLAATVCSVVSASVGGEEDGLDHGRAPISPSTGDATARHTASPGSSAASAAVDEPEDLAPGAMQWILALVLIAALVSGLMRVYQVLKATEQSTDSALASLHAPEGMRPVECGGCRTMQHVSLHGRIFICFSCHSANRISPEALRAPEPDLVAPTGPLMKFEFQKGGEHFWQELKREEIEESAAANVAAQLSKPVIIGRPAGVEVIEKDEVPYAERTENSDIEAGVVPPCAVCFDSPGCMVLLPCAHGGVCENCATRIAQNRASGGAHCPHCRSSIEALVKLHEIDDDNAKGIEYRIPIARAV